MFGILQPSRADTGHWSRCVNRIHVDPVLTRSPAGVDVTDRLPMEIPGHGGEDRDDGSPEQQQTDFVQSTSSARSRAFSRYFKQENGKTTHH